MTDLGSRWSCCHRCHGGKPELKLGVKEISSEGQAGIPSSLLNKARITIANVEDKSCKQHEEASEHTHFQQTEHSTNNANKLLNQRNKQKEQLESKKYCRYCTVAASYTVDGTVPGPLHSHPQLPAV
eukprot:1156347-Pelagomonas_calceolata.AAC.1